MVKAKLLGKAFKLGLDYSHKYALDKEEEWKTIKGTPVKIEEGEPQGAIGEKIKKESKASTKKSAKTYKKKSEMTQEEREADAKIFEKSRVDFLTDETSENGNAVEFKNGDNYLRFFIKDDDMSNAEIKARMDEMKKEAKKAQKEGRLTEYKREQWFKQNFPDKSLDDIDKEYPLKIGDAEWDYPMTHDEADNGNVNSLYNYSKDYQINCMRCVTVYELRRRGYRVEANGGWGLTPTSACFERKKENTHVFNELTGTIQEQVNEIDKTISQDPNSRFSISVAWKDGGNHVLTCSRDKNGVLSFYDPQTNESWSKERFASRFAKTIKNFRGCYRLDNVNPIPEKFSKRDFKNSAL